VVNLRTLRVWGVKSVLSVSDQGLSSFASFAVNLLLARWLKPEVYGAFAVVFAVFLFLTGFHNVLLLEPMSVLGSARYQGDLATYFRSQIRVHLLLTGGLAAVLLIVALGFALFAPGNLLTAPAVAGGVCLPPLLLVLLMRRMCYIMQRPQEAVYGSSLYVGLILLGLFSLKSIGGLRPAPVFFLMGLTSLSAAVLMARRLDLFAGRLCSRNRLQAAVILRENWSYGRWLVASTVLNSFSTQTQTFFAAGLLGLGGAGVLRAMQLPSLMMTQLSTATGLLVLPTFARDFGANAVPRMRHKAILVALALSLCATVVAGLTWSFSGRIDLLFFAGKYASFAWLMPVFVLVTIPFGPMQGFGMALRAARKPQFDLLSNIFAAPVGIVSAYFCTKWWGLAGAAVSLVLGFAVQGLITTLSFRTLLPAPKRSATTEGFMPTD
jgi:O-antigen/teichoic acid export membrane protein